MGRLWLAASAAASCVLCLLVRPTASQTTEPSWAPTGKLNQFRGFENPRTLPPNVEFVYASIWAAWSGWSFCSNGVRIRVRACNTVRGYSCLGPNQEFIPCEDQKLPSSKRPGSELPSDYDVVDPYEADRREAMKQLFPEKSSTSTMPSSTPKSNPNFLKIPKPTVAGSGVFRARVHAAEPIRPLEPVKPLRTRSEGRGLSHKKRRQEPDGASSLNHSKEKRIREHVGVRMENAHISSEDDSGRQSTRKAEQLLDDFPSANPLPIDDDSTRQSTNKREQLLDDFPTVKSLPIDENLLEQQVHHHHHLSAEDVKINQDELDKALSTLQLREEGRSGARSRQGESLETSTTKQPMEPRINKTVEDRPLSLSLEQDITKEDFLDIDDHESESSITAPQLDGNELGVTEEPETGTPGDILDDDDDFGKFHSRPEIAHRSKPDVEVEELEPLAEEIEMIPPSTTTEEPKPETSTFEVLENKEHFDEFGTKPEIVQPKLSNAIDDDDSVPEVVEPVLPVEEPVQPVQEEEEEPHVTIPIVTEPDLPTTTPIPTITSSSTKTLATQKRITSTPRRRVLPSAIRMPPLSLPDVVEGSAEANKAAMAQEARLKSLGVSRMLPERIDKKKKMKGFGFTGFSVKKATESKRYIHAGEVTKSPLPGIRASQEFSPDTLHALDWMLQNITKIAEEGDEAFMKALAFTSDESDSREIANIQTTTAKPKSLKKLSRGGKKRKGMSKGTAKKRKGSRDEVILVLHSGELRSPFKDGKKFPKVRTRVTEASLARSFGVKTVKDDQVPSKPPTSQEARSPAQLLEEIANLEAIMSDIKRKVELKSKDKSMSDGIHLHNGSPLQNSMERLDKSKEKADSQEDSIPASYPIQSGSSSLAMDLSLVPLEKGFIPGASPSRNEFYQQPIHVITPGVEQNTESRWTSWGDWAECFCGRQVRTRRCIYSGAMSRGCEGNSYESRSCEGGRCPVTHPPTRPPPIPITEATLPPEGIHQPHRRLKPLKLNTAISLS